MVGEESMLSRLLARFYLNGVFAVQLGVAAFGLAFVLLLRPAVQDVEADKKDKATTGPLYALKRAVQLSMTKEMALLGVTFFYTGQNVKVP